MRRGSGSACFESSVRGVRSIKSPSAVRRCRCPSQAMSSAMTPAATASAHHQPMPMPSTPNMAATAVSQSALFISASA
ncbi:hypothetical protein MYXA107069_20380 [Myxococcus xanthus]|nr:hypothetical protein MyxoNM_28295 [Myxococcus xanthus]SDX17052.1 hypothetical protein SAMN05444383_105415 [Myxococcus xanthus]